MGGFSDAGRSSSHGSGVRLRSSRARKRSCCGGSFSSRPRRSTGSSTSKPMSRRRQLEQHAARLAEVDRVEVLAVDDLRRMRAGLDRGRPQRRQLLVVGRAPGDVMDRAGALDPALRWRRVVDARRAAPLARDAVAVEAERVEQRHGSRRDRARRRARRAKPPSACSAGTSVAGGGERRVRGVGDDELVVQALGVGEAERRRRAASRAAPRPPGAPPRSRARPSKRTRQRTRCTIPAPARPGVASRNSKKVISEPGRAGVVAVVEVVDVGRVEVDGLLDHPQPEHARVPVDVAPGIAGDRGDVVEAFECHCVTVCNRACNRASRLRKCYRRCARNGSCGGDIHAGRGPDSDRAARVARPAPRPRLARQGARRPARGGARSPADLLRGAAAPRRGRERPNADARHRVLGAAQPQRPDAAGRPARARRPGRSACRAPTTPAAPSPASPTLGRAKLAEALRHPHRSACGAHFLRASQSRGARGPRGPLGAAAPRHVLRAPDVP